jgi:hypothetical protein
MCVCIDNLQAALAEVRTLTSDLRVETAVGVERDGCRPGREHESPRAGAAPSNAGSAGRSTADSEDA